jgi:hypothetical protein
MNRIDYNIKLNSQTLYENESNSNCYDSGYMIRNVFRFKSDDFTHFIQLMRVKFLFDCSYIAIQGNDDIVPVCKVH